MLSTPSSAADVRTTLGAGDEYNAWLHRLDDVRPVDGVTLTTPSADTLRRLRVPSAAIDTLLGNAPAEHNRPEVRWLLERCVALLAGGVGTDTDVVGILPTLPERLGAVGRCFYVHAFAAALPHVRAFHQANAVPDDVSWATLADLGRHVEIDTIMRGEVQLDSQNWLVRHWRGALLEHGRLQFERYRRCVGGEHDQPWFWYDVEPPTLQAPGLAVGRAALDLHIPRGAPLAPDECDASFERARAFYALVDRRSGPRIVTCTSWLLDEQLADYLRPDSNILRFQRRFEIVPGAADGTEEMHRFVFLRRPPIDLDALPQRTTLERAFVTHLRRGGRWQMRTGWIAL